MRGKSKPRQVGTSKEAASCLKEVVSNQDLSHKSDREGHRLTAVPSGASKDAGFSPRGNRQFTPSVDYEMASQCSVVNSGEWVPSGSCGELTSR